MASVAVIGAGSWGTALANLIAKNKQAVNLWVYEEKLFSIMERERDNTWYLSGYKLDKNISLKLSLKEAVFDAEIVFLVVPVQYSRQIIKYLKDFIDEKITIVSASKGIEYDSLSIMSQVISDELGSNYLNNACFISGPSFAKEVASFMPTAVVAASKNKNIAKKVQYLLSNEYFRVYSHTDVVGVEVAGAMKNVMAIAAGISDGLQFGSNARAALITRGLAEIKRIGCALGALPETFAGLAGMGDLVLTCTGDLSRNRQVGMALGKGQKLSQVLENMQMVAEGVKTTQAAYELTDKLGVEAPITSQIYDILFAEKEPRLAVTELMQRELKYES